MTFWRRDADKGAREEGGRPCIACQCTRIHSIVALLPAPAADPKFSPRYPGTLTLNSTVVVFFYCANCTVWFAKRGLGRLSHLLFRRRPQLGSSCAVAIPRTRLVQSLRMRGSSPGSQGSTGRRAFQLSDAVAARYALQATVGPRCGCIEVSMPPFTWHAHFPPRNARPLTGGRYHANLAWGVTPLITSSREKDVTAGISLSISIA